MTIVIGLVGWVVGMFMWSNIIGSLLATLPKVMKLRKAGLIKEVKWLTILGPTIFSLIILVIAYFLSRTFFYAALFGGLLILFNYRSLKREAVENIFRDYPELQPKNPAYNDIKKFLGR